nr:hypothetical protein [Acidobacteriota bacterium]
MSAPTIFETIAEPVTAAVEPAKEVGPAAVAPRSNRLTIIFCFLAIYVIWGSTYLAIRYAVETIPPLYAAGIRHLTSGSILLLWCLAKKLKPTWAQIRTSVVIGTLF